MRVRTILTGISPLLMKNPRMADPDFEIKQQIKKITAKGSRMTEADREEKEQLEFFGSLYIDEDGPYVPTTNIRKCFIEAGRPTKHGTHVDRAVVATTVKAPVIYEGPRDQRGLWGNSAFRYRTMANLNPNSSKKSMVPLMRPMFPKWSLDVEWELFTKALDHATFVDIVQSAGMTEGLGDGHKNGYGFGRFAAEVLQV